MTSKTSSLKALLLRAWRERWSDLQWGIHIKTILPRGVSGDVYNLADCILQQALVGPGPNQLVLSYLKHSLSSQLVSYAAVLQRISKYDSFNKPYCTISLLDFLDTIKGGITCRGKPEEGLLAGAAVSLVGWLLTCIQYALEKQQSEVSTNTELLQALLERPSALINDILHCRFMRAVLFLGKHECPDTYKEIVKKCQELEVLLLQNASFQPSVPLTEPLRKLSQLEAEDRSTDDGYSEPVTYCLQALLAVEVLLNPNSDTQMFVNEMLMIQRIKAYNCARLYSEIMRACLISLNDVLETSSESQWGAFTFLKVPQILLQLHRHHLASRSGELPDTREIGDYSKDIVDSIELLLQYTPLLDIMDSKCSCNCLEFLLKELQSVGLVTDAHVQHYKTKREGMIVAVLKPDQAAQQTPCIPKIITRAESTLSGILKTLDTDYVKIQEAVVSILCQVLTGKSFELILSVATVQGKLRTFVSKLIKFNECSKQIGGEGGKASQTRAVLFDVTFLMLCFIVHTYGSEVVLSEERGDSFFEQWVQVCMVERGHPKCPDKMLQLSDPLKVESLLTQFNSADSDFKTSQVKWHEVCLNVPSAINEVLQAWEHGIVSATDVKRILDAMRSRMACLPVCAATWLCSYMQILPQEVLLKPMNMVQQFLTPLTTEEINQPDNFKERAGLMFQIIRKMQYDVYPPTQSKVKGITLSHSIICREPISEQLSSVWSGIHQRGWINIEQTRSLESLLATGGSYWFVDNLVKEVMKYRHREELDRGADLALAVFHLDIEQCTQALLLQVLPKYLNNQLLSDELVEPQSSALAKLCAYCVYAALEAQNSAMQGTGGHNSRKRSRTRREAEGEEPDGCGPATKLLRLSVTDDLVFGPGTTSTSGSGSSSATSSSGAAGPALEEPLASALEHFFRNVAIAATRDGEISRQTHFATRLLQFMVRCGKDRSQIVLQAVPPTLVPSLVRSLPDLFTAELLLKLYDLNTAAGRKAAARDICLLRNMSLRHSTFKDMMQG
ncbi:mediator of RNA polymerase II transcription subunit 24 [Schistocerca americana]|uniref:mediator of RNA polymerase II transcription subunit 24 n=1 Tax=Schistocerca americana TaxID=7009 RepID=UPI001F50257F|nr:mediator of RNA polymerase II transcription subunit 24 [Schistocerca americana]XP_047114432.1 mediator of RNA polymerase II transcription subunit 24 [Schistocerca piceifrons]XP_049960111.1 mediator of RNA polymerase II transcription subunit 24 [Schistocerca serialis cubense]